jgi:hypothetical protein
MSGERIIRTDFSRGEAVGGLVWLSIAALVAVLLQVVYLGTWVTLPGGLRLAVPYTIVLAFLFNMVLTCTARLWNPNPAIAAVPLYAWLAGFLGMLSGVAVTGDQLIGDNIRTVLLLFAGVAGGVWPLVRGK